MNSECQSLLAVFARCFPQAHITLITSEQQYVLNLFMADERITHSLVISRSYLPSLAQVADFIEGSGLVALLELSPVALRLDITEEAGCYRFTSKPLAQA